MALTRTQISLSDEDRHILEAARRRTGRSMSALIRDAIHATYSAPASADRRIAALDMTFGVAPRHESGEQLVDSIRSGGRVADHA